MELKKGDKIWVSFDSVEDAIQSKNKHTFYKMYQDKYATPPRFKRAKYPRLCEQIVLIIILVSLFFLAMVNMLLDLFR